jgi:hypothetical protein
MKLQDYIHYYMGCAFWTDNSEGQVNAETIRYIIPMIDKGKNVQLKLRRLEDMKEDEMVTLLTNLFPFDMDDKPTADEFSMEMFYNDDGLMVDGDVSVGANYKCRCYIGQIAIKQCGSICFFDEAGNQEHGINVPRAYHYLLTQRFDIFSLIDAGLAVDAKSINS